MDRLSIERHKMPTSLRRCLFRSRNNNETENGFIFIASSAVQHCVIYSLRGSQFLLIEHSNPWINIRSSLSKKTKL